MSPLKPSYPTTEDLEYFNITKAQDLKTNYMELIEVLR